jgi:hypothetical protein
VVWYVPWSTWWTPLPSCSQAHLSSCAVWIWGIVAPNNQFALPSTKNENTLLYNSEYVSCVFKLLPTWQEKTGISVYFWFDFSYHHHYHCSTTK